jgi:hypothetical protein
MMSSTKSPARTILSALVIAAVYLGLTQAIVAATPEYLTPEIAKRLRGVMAGLLVFGYANVASKTLTPLSRMRWDPVAEQALRRFAAWALSLGALAYAAAWVIVPIEYASTVATVSLASALVIVAVRLVRCVSRRALA